MIRSFLFSIFFFSGIVLICDVGAYGFSLGSNYNARPLPAEILIKNSKILTIKNRQKLSEII